MLGQRQQLASLSDDSVGVGSNNHSSICEKPKQGVRSGTNGVPWFGQNERTGCGCYGTVHGAGSATANVWVR